jgi:hypothetical protein
MDVVWVSNSKHVWWQFFRRNHRDAPIVVVSSPHVYPILVLLPAVTSPRGSYPLDFIFGLDMLKRHQCSIDLKVGRCHATPAPNLYRPYIPHSICTVPTSRTQPAPSLHPALNLYRPYIPHSI